VAVLAGLSIAAAAGTTAVVVAGNDGDTTVIAMGQSEMSPLLQKAARWCLTPGKSDPTHPVESPVVTMADLAVAAQRDDWAGQQRSRRQTERGTDQLRRLRDRDRPRTVVPPSRSNRHDRCYVDPTGTVVYGKPGKDCLPAQTWRH
jgi:hypothetical protein